MVEGLVKLPWTDGTEDVFNLKLNAAPCLHDNGKIAKLINLNYIACSNLIVDSDISTDYMYIKESNRVIIKDTTKVNKFILLQPECVLFYEQVIFNGNFKFMTIESYNRIKDLCTDLINKYKV